MKYIYRNIFITSSEFLIIIIIEIFTCFKFLDSTGIAGCFDKVKFIRYMAIYVFFGLSRLPLSIHGLYLLLCYANYTDINIQYMIYFLFTIFEHIIVTIFAFCYLYKK